jgi:hypothetical protein
MFYRSNTILEFCFYASNREEGELVCALDRSIAAVFLIKFILVVQNIHQCYIDIDIPIVHLEGCFIVFLSTLPFPAPLILIPQKVHAQ